MRLEGGDGRCAGGVEMKHQGEWRRVNSWEPTWDLRAATVVCRQLDCGSAVSIRDDNETHAVWMLRFNCVGSESALRECVTVHGELTSSYIIKVICSGNTHNIGLFTVTVAVSKSLQQTTAPYRCNQEQSLVS